MATVTVTHNPELTPEGALEVFRSHFAGKYDVYKSTPTTWLLTARPRHFVVKKSVWTSVGVKLQKGTDNTTFVFTPFMALPIVNWTIAHDMIKGLFLKRRWEEMEEEIASFIENAREFTPPGEEHFRRGLELGDSGEWQEAVAEFDRAISLNPNHLNAYIQRGFAYAELEEAERAVADMEKAIALTRDRDTVANLEANIKELREGGG